MADDGRQVSFGIKTSQAGVSYHEILKVWLEADNVPAITDAWLWDHLVPLRGNVNDPALEAWTLLAGLAAQTSRLRLGVIVTSNRLRPPALLAKMAATVDIMAGGRLVFGIGAGGSAVSDPAQRESVHREYDAFGIDVVPPAEALAALDETCQLVKRLWSEDEPFDFDGHCYHLKGAICEPKPIQQPRPPIMIGAGGERSLRVVAQHADIWASPTFTVADFRRKSAMLTEYCVAVGRDPAEITRSAQVFFTALETPPPGFPFPGPAGARELIAELIDAGAQHLVLAPIGMPSVKWVAEEIIEPVLANGS